MNRHPDTIILHRNWVHTRVYLRYCVEVRQLQDININRIALDYLLNWATDIPLSQAPAIRPVFPVYLESVSTGGPDYRKKLLADVRAFFLWSKAHWPSLYAALNPQWIETLRTRKLPGQVRERQVFNVDSVRAVIAAIPTARRIDRRDRAAIAFLFLSGMRASAFCSLPVCAINLTCDPPLIRQWPALGVRTKFGKALNTTLLPEAELGDLWAVVREWDTEVRPLGETAMWFAVLERDGQTWSAAQQPGVHRDEGLRKRTCQLCRRAGVVYLSPHKLRRGHTIWASKRCVSVADYVAVQENLGHEAASMTLEYNRLPEAEARQRIAHLVANSTGITNAELLELVRQALNMGAQ